MLEQENDKEMQRNQLMAMVLMFVMLGAWMFFFAPEPPQPQEEGAPQTTESGEVRELNPSIGSPDTIAAAPPAEAAVEGLPPVATETTEDDHVVLENDEITLVFTKIGARLKEASLHTASDDLQLVPEYGDLPDHEAVYPLGLRFAENYLGEALNVRRWNASVDPAEQKASFSIDVGGARIEKIFQLAGNSHVVDTQVRYTNLTSEPTLIGVDAKEAAFSLVWAPQVTSHDLDNYLTEQKILLHLPDEELERFATDGIEPPPAGSLYSDRRLNVDWAAVRSAYFVVAMKPEFPNSDTWFAGDGQSFYLGVGVPRVEVPAEDTVIANYRVYIGPNQESYLAEAGESWATLPRALEFFEWFASMDWFAKFLLGLLNWMHNNIYANFGVAIILLTLLVRTVVFPLTWKSMMSMKKMQKVAPELEKLKEEYGDDPEEMQKKQMEFFRERGINPLGGCLPMFLQMPVFIALYRMLGMSYELRGAPFAGWMTDLSAPDRLIEFDFSIPVIFFEIDALNLLPILMGVCMFASTKLTPGSQAAMSNPQQKMLMNIMPVMFAVICYNMSSGLNLYILTSTLLGIAQNLVIQRMDIEVDVKKNPKKTKTAAKPKHFYNAAQARKRELNKEKRREKKAKVLSAKDEKGKRS